jgi:hypothetical protein
MFPTLNDVLPGWPTPKSRPKGKKCTLDVCAGVSATGGIGGTDEDVELPCGVADCGSGGISLIIVEYAGGGPAKGTSPDACMPGLTTQLPPLTSAL